MYFLSISILENDFDIPFMSVCKDCRWIYAISRNYPLLQAFRQRIEVYTNENYLPFMRIEILPLEILREDEIDSNNPDLWRF